MSQHFTHLHVHTDYSLLDGAIHLDKLVNFGKAHNLKALAISDHGNIFGAVKFFEQCKKAGIKPVLGIEAYLTENARVKDASNKYYHILIIVENSIGYKNLCKLIAFGYNEGFYFKPRIDYEILEKHSEGLIITTACLGGHIPTLLMTEQYEKANTLVDWYLRVFGPERFYLEVQPEDQQDQKILNERIWRLAQQKNVRVVATGDCHYVTPEDREAHEIMLAIQTHHKFTDPDRFSFGDCRVHMRTPEEMLTLFSEHPEAVWASGEIADRCNFSFETGKLFFPLFDVPEGHTEASYFKHICTAGLNNLLDNNRIERTHEKQYWKRLNLEIELIISMGFVGYFLVVSDFIQWARRTLIPVGPGRGSAAGSLVAWALQITDIDPIKYNLLFERFLNPERVTMPDIDIDFCIEGRDRVINYVRERYGHDKVCQIITFGTMMAKGVIKDVARVLGFPFEDSNALTDLIPDQLKITLKEALEIEPRLQKLLDNNTHVAKLFDLAFRLEGLTRHASKHAAGIVISPEPITDMLPVYIPPKSSDLVTQFAMTELESLGFLKMDFLGLKNLTLIERTRAMIYRTRGVTCDISRIPLDDQDTFALLCRGDTSGVFQLESEGIKDVLKRLEPRTFEDIIAVNALYRPGPLGSGMVDDFIERKHGRQAIMYIFPELEPMLQETYGVIVYQEQVMKIASAIGNYSLGEADILRRAMGKKKADVMAQQKSIFAERAEKQGFNKSKAEELFELMAYFAGYGFNKSHSAAYALIAYQTAYLKAQYTAEFLACLISLEASDSEKMAFYIQEAKSHAISIIPPDINSSGIDFDVVQGSIRFGLQGIRNLGSAAIESIISERTKNGSFIDMLDFCTRVDLRTCNKRTLESLICAGACDTLPGNRAQKYEELGTLIDRALEKKRARETGQLDLFGSSTDTSLNTSDIYLFTPRDDWASTVMLEKEKEVLGLYVSAQPLDPYHKPMQWLRSYDFATAAQRKGLVLCCGTLKSTKPITTKKGDLMAFAQFEDPSGTAEVIIFPKLYQTVSGWLNDYTVFVIKGEIDENTRGTCKIKANKLLPLELVLDRGTGLEEITLVLPQTPLVDSLAHIKSQLTPGGTKLAFIISEHGKRIKITAQKNTAFSSELVALLEQHNIMVQLQL